jgi:hypothetical protein
VVVAGALVVVVEGGTVVVVGGGSMVVVVVGGGSMVVVVVGGGSVTVVVVGGSVDVVVSGTVVVVVSSVAEVTGDVSSGDVSPGDGHSAGGAAGSTGGQTPSAPAMTVPNGIDDPAPEPMAPASTAAAIRAALTSRWAEDVDTGNSDPRFQRGRAGGSWEPGPRRRPHAGGYRRHFVARSGGSCLFAPNVAARPLTNDLGRGAR